MNRALIIASVFICSLSATAHAQEMSAGRVPCGNNGTQAEANACARLEYQKADAEMKKQYSELMVELADYGNIVQQKLRRAQTLWSKYREATCESEASIYAGGSIRPAVYYSCLASITKERAKRLAEFLTMIRQ